MNPQNTTAPAASAQNQGQIVNLANHNCIQVKHALGHNIYVDICNGQAVQVPWGSLDWTIFVLAAVVVAAGAIGCLKKLF